MARSEELFEKAKRLIPSQFETCLLSSTHSQQDINHTVEVATIILSEQGNLGAKPNR